MKVVFDVEKRDEASGKTYFPGVVYEMSEEKANAIVNQTKHAHIVVDNPIVRPVENSVEEVENSVEEKAEKPKRTKSKKV